MQHSTIISVLKTLLILPALATAAPHSDRPTGGAPAVDVDGNTHTHPASMPVITGPVTFTQTVSLRNSEYLSTMDIASATLDAEQYYSIMAQISPNSVASVDSEKNNPTKRAVEHPKPTAMTTQSYWANGRLTTHTIAVTAATGAPPRPVKREPLRAVDDLDRRFESTTPMDSEADLVNRLPGHEHEPMATTSENPVPTLY